MANSGQDQRAENLRIQVLLGGGLVLVGLALILWFLPRAKPVAPIPTEDDSVVPAAVEFPAPEIALDDIDGDSGSLRDYAQHVVLVNNWATWCPPCKAEMPILEAYYEAHVQDGLMVVAIAAGETRADVLPFARAHALKFAVWPDPQTISLHAFHNNSLPSSYVIDRLGTVRYAWTGPINRSMLEKYVTPLISQAD